MNILEQAKDIMSYSKRSLVWTNDICDISIGEFPDDFLDQIKKSKFVHISLRRAEHGLIIEPSNFHHLDEIMS